MKRQPNLTLQSLITYLIQEEIKTLTKAMRMLHPSMQGEEILASIESRQIIFKIS